MNDKDQTNNSQFLTSAVEVCHHQGFMSHYVIRVAIQPRGFQFLRWEGPFTGGALCLVPLLPSSRLWPQDFLGQLAWFQPQQDSVPPFCLFFGGCSPWSEVYATAPSPTPSISDCQSYHQFCVDWNRGRTGISTLHFSFSCRWSRCVDRFAVIESNLCASLQGYYHVAAGWHTKRCKCCQCCFISFAFFRRWILSFAMTGRPIHRGQHQDAQIEPQFLRCKVLTTLWDQLSFKMSILVKEIHFLKCQVLNIMCNHLIFTMPVLLKKILQLDLNCQLCHVSMQVTSQRSKVSEPGGVLRARPGVMTCQTSKETGRSQDPSQMCLKLLRRQMPRDGKPSSAVPKKPMMRNRTFSQHSCRTLQG